MSKRSGLLAAFVGLSLLLEPGCGSGRVSVRGKVTLDGRPVDGGAIVFRPTGGAGTGANAGTRIEAGKYSLPADRGPGTGKFRVEISWQKPTGKKVPIRHDPPNLMDETRQVIPEKYNKNSELTADLDPGLNTIDFELMSE